MIKKSFYIFVLPESFIGLRLNPDEFYLVILPQCIRWALMKYHIKPLGMAKTFTGTIYFYTRRDYVSTSAIGHRAGDGL